MVTFEDVVDWVDGLLDARAAAAVEEAVAADAQLAATAAWLRSFRSAVSGRSLERPPPEVRDMLMRRFAVYRPAPPIPLQRVTATVAFDSATAGPVSGVRAVAGSAARHLALESPSVDIALDLYPEDREVRVEGQLLPLDPAAPASGTVRLFSGGKERQVVHADDAGWFAFEPVGPGPALLTAELGEVLVDVQLHLQV